MPKPGQAINVRLAPQDIAILKRIAQPKVRVDGARAQESVSEIIRRLIRAAGAAAR